MMLGAEIYCRSLFSNKLRAEHDQQPGTGLTAPLIPSTAQIAKLERKITFTYTQTFMFACTS